MTTSSAEKRFEFVPFTHSVLQLKTSKRDGELKIGEQMATSENVSKEIYFLLGINEDIGPQANYGKPGSIGAFDAFMDYFANIQSNEFLDGKSICILGQVNQMYSHSSIDNSRLMVRELDDFIEYLLETLVPKGGIPIVIGGGHNNAYPLIKWSSKRLSQPINIINIDPHADMRPMEGRHSGNSFSYAIHEGFVKKYHIIGLHQSYNSQYILEQLRANNCLYSFFDDYVQGNSFTDDLEGFHKAVSSDFYGVDLDMDAIEHMPSSALTPTGISIHQARKYVCQMAKSSNVLYLHLPEAAPTEKTKYLIGKTLAYLVADFIKTNQRH